MLQKLKARITNVKSNLKYFKFKYLSIHLLFAILILTLFPAPAFAQTSTPSTSSTIPYTLTPIPSTVSPTSPLFTDLLVYNIFHTLSCLAVGNSVIGQPCLTYQITKNAEGMVQGVPVLSSVDISGGVLGTTTSLIGALYLNPPIRTADYLASVGQGLGIVKEAHAQVVGSGANVLSPIEKLWEVSRNISYVIMIIIFVIIGLMVMFRQRINPQTVITAQAALPGLVIGLILITFSYFMAALISDTAFIGTNLVGYYFQTAQGIPPQNLVDKASGENVLSIFSRYTGIITKENASDTLSAIWKNFTEDVQRLLTLLSTFVVSNTTVQGTELFKAIPGFGIAIQTAITIATGGYAIANPTAVVGLVLAFIATAILIYQMFRLLLRLINNFLSIIFLTITAPFQFLAAALPGRQGIATAWILNMLANVLVFPAVLAVFYFVAFLLGRSFGPLNVSDLNQIKDGSLTPTVYAQGKIQIVRGATFPLFGGLDLGFINILLAFGALVALPAIPDIIVRTIGRVTQAGQLIGQEVSGGVSAGRGYAGQFQQGVGGASRGVAQGRQAFPTMGWEWDGNQWKPSRAPLTGARPGLATKIKGLTQRPVG